MSKIDRPEKWVDKLLSTHTDKVILRRMTSRTFDPYREELVERCDEVFAERDDRFRFSFPDRDVYVSDKGGLVLLRIMTDDHVRSKVQKTLEKFVKGEHVSKSYLVIPKPEKILPEFEFVQNSDGNWVLEKPGVTYYGVCAEPTLITFRLVTQEPESSLSNLFTELKRSLAVKGMSSLHQLYYCPTLNKWNFRLMNREKNNLMGVLSAPTIDELVRKVILTLKELTYDEINQF